MPTSPARHSAVAENATHVRDAYPAESDVIEHQARLKRGHLPVRELFQAAPHVLGALRPCWAMSPLVVSQLLPAVRCFDVVIFDEASQVTPADAVGALMRADRAIVAGDPHQLPPTSFFTTSGGGEDDEDAEAQVLAAMAGTQNMESILDVMGALLPPPKGTRTLNWHYRSEDERLIAFSNAQPNLYDWALTTFPGVAGTECLSHVLVPFRPGRIGQEDSVSDEVTKVVELVTEHARTRPDASLGVIAMGIKHANRIQEALRRAQTLDQDLAAFVEGTASPRAAEEKFFVKNLERVQGDERDAIILTIGYGKNADGRMMYRFGPVNNEGGERRLNVAITRARSQMTVVSSFSAVDMDPSRLRAAGAQMLRGYLAYAESGGTDLGNVAKDKPDLNPFERDVEAQLRAAGIPLIPQYGCSGYWIDFAAQHPTRPGQMVLAIECDGATYHSSATARDRDRLRQEHLERLGWTFHRIWSQDWFYRHEEETERAVAAYQKAVVAADPRERQQASNVVERLDEQTESSVTALRPMTRRSGPCPILTHRSSIDDYSLAELVALVNWIESDTLLRTEDQLLAEIMLVLGFQRRGSKITTALTSAIAWARRLGLPRFDGQG
jgi:very-short-patch-repair endonuclease